MLSFNSYDNKSVVRSRFDKILTEMSVYDKKYPIGTEFAPSSRPEMLKKAQGVGLPFQKDDKLVKVQPTSDSIQIQLGDGDREVYIKHKGDVYHIIGAESSITPMFVKIKAGGGVNWNAGTLEACQCMGLFVDAEKMFKDLAGGKVPIDDIFKDIESTLTNGKDYDQSGVDGVLSVLRDPNKRSIGDMTDVVRLAAGMTAFKRLKLSPKFNHVIHGKIEDYYKAEKENPQIEKVGSKKPTPDCIICNKPADVVITAMKTKKVEFDEDTGICSMDGDIEFVLASLKKEKGGGQLGKYFKAIKDRYGLEDFDQMYQHAMAEGWFSDTLGKVKNIGVKVWDSIKATFNKLVGKIFRFGKDQKDKLITRMNKDPMGDFQALLDKSRIKVKISEEVLMERKAANVVPYLKNLNPRDLQKLSKTIDREIISYKKSASKFNNVLFSGATGLRVDGKESIDERIKLYTNWVTITALKEMFSTSVMSNSKSLAQEIVDLQREMFFGSTILPVYKVYGAIDMGDEKTFEYLGSAQSYADTKMDALTKTDIPLVGIRAMNDKSQKYYTMYSAFCMGMTEEGELEYIRNRMGTNKAGGQWSYVFEGYQIIDSEEFNKKYNV
jgi:hypothetical protein